MDLLNTALNQRFRLDQEIGRGGFGVVYRATDLHLGRAVAVKVLFSRLASRDSAQRFLREAQVSSQLQDPHIITTYDFGAVEGGVIFIVTELLKGLSLAGLQTEVSLSMTYICDLMTQAIQGLLTAHQAGVVHRDIKPANLFIEWRNQVFLKVIDFGIAKALQTSKDDSENKEDAGETQTKALFGTPHYMSPEQVRSTKNVKFGTDVYSLGVVLYELIFDQLPFDSDEPIQIMIKHLQEPLPNLEESRPERHSWLSESQWSRVISLVEGMLHKSEEDRLSDLNRLINNFRDLTDELKRENPDQFETEKNEIKQLIESKAIVYSDDNTNVSLPSLEATSGIYAIHKTAQGVPQADLSSLLVDQPIGETLDSSAHLEASKALSKSLMTDATVDWDDSTHIVPRTDQSPLTHVNKVATYQPNSTLSKSTETSRNQSAPPELAMTLDTVRPLVNSTNLSQGAIDYSLSQETITPMPEEKNTQVASVVSNLQADFVSQKGFNDPLHRPYPTMFPEENEEENEERNNRSRTSSVSSQSTKRRLFLIILIISLLVAARLFVLLEGNLDFSGQQPTESKPTEGSSTESKPTEGSSTESKPTEGSSTESKPTEGSSTESKPTEGSSTESKPTEVKPKPSRLKLYLKSASSYSVGDQVKVSAKVFDQNGKKLKQAVRYYVSPRRLAKVKRGKINFKHSGEGSIKACLKSNPKLCSRSRPLYVINPF